MNLEALANLGEVIGAVAVVISLVYLAIQVRQGTQAQRTENYARVLERTSEMQSLWSQDSELSRLFARGVEDAAALTPEERIRFTWSLYEVFGSFEFMFHAAENRSIPDYVWKRWSATVAWWLGFGGVQTWWQNRPVAFSDGFTAYVDDILARNPSDADAARRWKQFVHGSTPE